MSNTKRTENSHYVQKAYLKEFASNDKKTHIFCFDKYTLKSKIEKIKDCATSAFYYPQWLEEWLNQKVENYGIESVRKLIYQKNFNQLNPSEKIDIARWIFIQFIRTPEFESILTNSLKLHIKEAKKYNHPAMTRRSIENYESIENQLKKQDDYSPDFKRVLWDFMKNTYKLHHKLVSEYQWVIFENKTRTRFLTSDNPIILNYLKDPKAVPFNFKPLWYGNDFIVHLLSIEMDIPDAINFYVPLNPDLLLYITKESTKYKNYQPLKNAYSIIDINKMLSLQSTRFLFSNKEEFQHVFMALRQFPEARFKKKSRLKIKSMDLKTSPDGIL